MSQFAIQGLATGAALAVASYGIIFGIIKGRPRTPRAQVAVLAAGLGFAAVALIAIWVVLPVVVPAE